MGQQNNPSKLSSYNAQINEFKLTCNQNVTLTFEVC